MLPRKYRAGREDIRDLHKRAKRIGEDHVSLMYRIGENGENPRFSCVISKKTARKAVDRNKVKRQCREIIRDTLGTLSVPVVGIIKIHKTEDGMTFQTLKREISEAVRKTQIEG